MKTSGGLMLFSMLMMVGDVNSTAGQTTQTATTQPDAPAKPRPDQPNMRYGPHERNVVDFWNARRPANAGPAPLVIYFHGGGFRGGDKSGVNSDFVNQCLGAGFAVASANYRLSHQAPFPSFMHDGARAVQFLRSKAEELKIDSTRVAAFGGSAGAGISLWLGFHDDLADPKSDDSIARESSRLSCMAVFNGQTSYDPRFFAEHGLAPAAEHPFIIPFYGIPREEYDTPKAHKLFDEAAPIFHLTKDDPPAMLVYAQQDIPLPNGATAQRNDPKAPSDMPSADPMASRAIHHPTFGTVLKQRMDQLGIECIVKSGVTPQSPESIRDIVAFIRRQFELRR